MQLTKQDAVQLRRRAKRGEIITALQELEQIHDGMLTPYDVVDEARSPKSVLHGAFDWDDKKAGEKYRLIQARILLTTVKVEYMGEKREAFFNATVQIGGVPTRGYFPIERVMDEEEIKRDVINQAVRELEHAQQKYKEISELTGVINTRKLRAVKASLQTPSKRKRGRPRKIN
jgi:hypothetical protein